ncbi:endonuclease [Prosthecochloris sp. ZM]|uniref:endonuclease/exonuclease/phosphatase family protein n=1 Tax=Prosthecochloris sp. ZM TaxID=2283143 RepID=UPI000DF837F5|nr:endonuclease/exonuclease/phosphatase family protein [Prosthecochloris sp. ZM]RDD30710.1 endonuclease [Prosthecochloris sp. ZM]
MPLYAALKARTSDSATLSAWKKRTAARLLTLRAALHDHIYRYRGDTSHTHERDDAAWLRVATWNLREFDTPKYGGRLGESIYFIAEIISHFDLVAVQEVREDLRALGRVINILGSHEWDFIATDVTEGRPGNRERMVFIYRTSKVRFTNVAGELTLSEKDKITHSFNNAFQNPAGISLAMPVAMSELLPSQMPLKKSKDRLKLASDVILDLPEEASLRLPPGTKLILKKGMEVRKTDGALSILAGDAPDPELIKDAMVLFPEGLITHDELQFARTPFLVTFQAGWLKCMFCTVHIYYGSGSEGLALRNQEIERLTRFLAKRARNENDSDANNFFFVLGDFNIVGKDHTTWESLHTNGFSVPEQLRAIPHGSNVKRDKAYDQIAFWQPGSRSRKGSTCIDIGNAGIFDFFKYVFREGEDDAEGEDEQYYADAVGKTKLNYRTWRTYQMSDHLPMWIELRIDFCDDYLCDISRQDDAVS